MNECCLAELRKALESLEKVSQWFWESAHHDYEFKQAQDIDFIIGLLGDIIERGKR